MTTAPPPLSPRFVSIPPPQGHDAAADMAAGLLQPAASLPPKFLYDPLGSALFNAITELPEYYPTRTEAAILAQNLPALAALLPPGRPLVDLGAGDGAKAARLLQPLRVSRYVAIDISQTYLRQAVQAQQARHPGVPMVAVDMDFSQHLALPADVLDGPALVFYPGSSIGNFERDAALALLQRMLALARGGALLIGVDLDKPVDVLLPAYDDAIGVTAAFNLNMLRHVNQVLGTDFNVRNWRHRVVFNEAASRIEMHLQARHDVLVRWPGQSRVFATGACIHTESSHKWTAGAFESMLRDAGWRHVQRWTDPRAWFGVFLAQA